MCVCVAYFLLIIKFIYEMAVKQLFDSDLPVLIIYCFDTVQFIKKIFYSLLLTSIYFTRNAWLINTYKM